MNTLRVIYQGIHSKPSATAESLATDYATRTVLRISWPPIHSTSIVLISASECHPDPDNDQRISPIFARSIGDAAIPPHARPQRLKTRHRSRSERSG
jgi:hypothetical protein